MFTNSAAPSDTEPLRLSRWPAPPAGDATADSGAGEGSRPHGIAEALGLLDRSLDAAAAVDLDAEDDRALLAAVQEQERLLSRAMSQQLRLLGAVHRRGSYGLDGAITAASWYRGATRLDAGEATRRVQAADRLASFPSLAEALACGNVTWTHAMAITRAAVPSRIDAIADHEDTLVELALTMPPRVLGVALRRIADHTDPDGSDHREPPSRDRCGPDARRELTVRSTFDGLGEVVGWLEQVDTELLLVLLDAYDEPDPPDTPPKLRRSPAQRRADAFSRLLRAVADAGTAPTVNGIKPHLLLGVDLAELLGLDPSDSSAAAIAELLGALLADADPAALAELLATLAAASDEVCGHEQPPTPQPQDRAPQDRAPDRRTPRPPPPDSAPATQPADDPTPADGRIDLDDLLRPDPAAAARGPRLRRTGPLPWRQACRVALDARVTCVLTMGPWRVVNVGRTMRTLPPWLRPILELRHRRCRGPDCDRPASWTEAHHLDAWTADQGDTDLNRMIPLCTAHHATVTDGTWTVDYDAGTGICTWTGPDGSLRRTLPPAR